MTTAVGGDVAAARVDRMRSLAEDLFPVCRSIMGPGTRATLDRVAAEVPIERHGIASGQPVLDWTVPDEWSIRDAWISRVGESERLVDFRDSNLHVVSHSEPVDTTMPLDALQQHLHSLPDRPDSIPYRTSYYVRNWGFCLADRLREGLTPGDYRVVIDATLEPGTLEWGELFVPGTTTDEVLLTTHICHPSLANDNTTGIAALVETARHLLDTQRDRRFSYRLLFLPGTIGSIAWLSQPRSLERIRHGLVLTGLGDTSPLTFKHSRRGDADIDRIVPAVLHGREFETRRFSPYGYDERQFCSPGFDLPVGRLTRGVHGEYPEYHTSADDLSFVSWQHLDRSVEAVVEILDALEANARFRNLSPYGEPQLGRRGLYSSTGGAITDRSVEMAYLWVLSLSDGEADLCDIAARADLPFGSVAEASRRLVDAGLLERLP